ncbi:MAG TPA: MarR family winged helix-turn-helix transcriptional regulator [Acidimicrobiales bacterium]|jgi:DNA-binding MarR family transcriptional regulator|nr:MarR family winged helix-turn-helix transcriptional regulator [Acidimicrobiales bacterium]
MPAARPSLALDDQLCFALYSAFHAVMRTYRPLLAAVELTYPQYVTLLALWDDPGRTWSVGELCRRLHLDTGTLTPMLKRLEAAGYLTRRRDRADERRVHVELTPAGLALRDQVASVPASLAACVGLDAATATRLRADLRALADSLDDAATAG